MSVHGFRIKKINSVALMTSPDRVVTNAMRAVGSPLQFADGPAVHET